MIQYNSCNETFVLYHAHVPFPTARAIKSVCIKNRKAIYDTIK